MLCHALVRTHASIGKLLCNRNQFSPFLIGFRGDIDLCEKRVVIVDAIDRRSAEAGAAWVPSDNVKPVEQCIVINLGCKGRKH